VVTTRPRPMEIPRVHRDSKLLDLFPPSSGGWCTPIAWHVSKIHKSGGVNVVERELLQSFNRCSLNGNSQTDECVIDRISSIPLGWVLVRTGDGEMSKVGHVCHCLDKCRYIGSCMKDRRVLLCQEVG
jgi:hypothetical protein